MDRKLFCSIFAISAVFASCIITSDESPLDTSDDIIEEQLESGNLDPSTMPTSEAEEVTKDALTQAIPSAIPAAVPAVMKRKSLFRIFPKHEESPDSTLLSEDECTSCLSTSENPAEECVSFCGSYLTTWNSCPPDDASCVSTYTDEVCTTGGSFILLLFNESSEGGFTINDMIDLVDSNKCGSDSGCINRELLKTGHIEGSITFNALDALSDEEKAELEEYRDLMPILKLDYDITLLSSHFFGTYTVTTIDNGDVFTANGYMRFDVDFNANTTRIYDQFTDTVNGSHFISFYEKSKDQVTNKQKTVMKLTDILCGENTTFTQFGSSDIAFEDTVSDFRGSFAESRNALTESEKTTYCAGTPVGTSDSETLENGFSINVKARINVTTTDGKTSGTLEKAEIEGKTTWEKQAINFYACFDTSSCTTGTCDALGTVSYGTLDRDEVDSQVTEDVLPDTLNNF